MKTLITVLRKLTLLEAVIITYVILKLMSV